MDGVGATQFGLTVELAKWDTHGQEKLERIRPQGGTTGSGGTQVGEPETVLEGAKKQEVSQRRFLASLQCLHTALHTVLVKFLLQGRGIHHA